MNPTQNKSSKRTKDKNDVIASSSNEKSIVDAPNDEDCERLNLSSRNKEHHNMSNDIKKDMTNLDKTDKIDKTDKTDKIETNKEQKSAKISEEVNLKNQSELINALQKQIALLTQQLASMQGTENLDVGNNAVKLSVHKEVIALEKQAYDKIRETVAAQGPRMEIRPLTVKRSTPFSSPLSIKTLNQIPTLFTIETIGSVSTKVESSINEPKYLAASRRAFGFGITETKFIMKSQNLKSEINFSPSGSAGLLEGTIGATPGPVQMDSSKLGYVLRIAEVLFKIYLNSQFVLCDVEFKTVFDRNDYAGDCVSMNGMLRHQYVDQDIPLLPAAGYGNLTKYVFPTVREMFAPLHHTMLIGELSRDLISQKKVFRRAGVITDQYLAETNDLYLTYLASRSIDYHAYLEQHRVLTMPQVSVKIEKPSVFQTSLIPVWRRDECDGALLLYALDVSRQQKYLNHLTELLESINLVSFADVEEVSNFGPRKNLHDPDIERVLDGILTSSNQYDFFRALAMDLSTTWIDCELNENFLTTGPLNAVFKVFSVLLWYCYFPSLARDNSARLMYILFSALQILARREVDDYVLLVGFSDVPGRAGTIQNYPKEDYLSGRVNFPFLQRRPQGRYPILARIYDIIRIEHGRIIPTQDSALIQTPRMANVRRFYQPYDQLPAISNTPVDGENPNELATRLHHVIDVLIRIVEAYKREYRDYTNRNIFGNSTTSVSQLIGFLQGFTSSILAGIGIRGHAEMYCLRTIGANSPYVPDCQNLDHANYRLRPQVLFQSENGDLNSIIMQRLQEELPFELPIFLFFTLRGALSVQAITPPDVSVQFKNLQALEEEGILCGDVIKFVNNIKFGHVGVFNREMLGISNVITAARADRIFIKLSEMAELSQFKDIFQILIHSVGARIDNRSINFRIALQVYNNAMYDAGIVQPDESLYGMDLRLGRPLMDEIMTTVSPLFVPETSPISLYTNGLVAIYQYETELDPMAYVDLEQLIEHVDLVLMWSSSFMTRRIKDGQRFIDEDVLRLPTHDGDEIDYRVGDNMPLTLFIMTSNTGGISVADFSKLYRFFTEGKIMFFLPELMVIMNRVIVEQSESQEILLREQLEEVITGAPNRRINIAFGDTISKPYRLMNTTQKLKFLRPVAPINQRDIILRGVTDVVQQPPEFQIGSWMSWAYGGINGKTLFVHNGEAFRNNEGIEELNAGNERVINKLELGLVNMNNEMRILTMPEYIQTPEVIQDTERAYAGIYTFT